MKKRIRVLQLQPDYHENSHNYSDLAEQIVAAFPRERYEVTSAFIRGKPVDGHPSSRAEKTIYFNFPKEALRGLRLQLPGRIYRFCQERQFDVVICNRFKQVSLMMMLNHFLKIPVCVGISHGFGEYDAAWRRQRMRLLLDKSWYFVGVSPAVRDYLLAQKCGFTEENTTAIINAFDIQQAEAEQFSRHQAREILGLPQNDRIIGAAGRLVRIKGHIHLIRAFAEINKKHSDTYLAIIGEGREEAALKEEICRLGMQDRIFLPGFYPGAKRYVKAFDLWAMPSLSEGLGLALLEGMCGHLPVIGSKIPAMTPLIEGAGGIAVPPADAEALANALDIFLSFSASELAARGEKSYEYLCREHAIDDYRKKYLELVEKALAAL